MTAKVNEIRKNCKIQIINTVNFWFFEEINKIVYMLTVMI